MHKIHKLISRGRQALVILRTSGSASAATLQILLAAVVAAIILLPSGDNGNVAKIKYV